MENHHVYHPQMVVFSKFYVQYPEGKLKNIEQRSGYGSFLTTLQLNSSPLNGNPLVVP